MLNEKTFKSHYIALCILAAFPLYSLRITVLSILLFFIISLITYFRNKNKIKATYIFELFVYLFPFVLIAIWCLLIYPNEESSFYLERSLSLIVFPLSYFLAPITFTGKKKFTVFYIFASSTVLICSIGLLASFYQLNTMVGTGKFWSNYTSMIHHADYPYYLRTFFENTVSLHPTYACIYLGISMLILFYVVLHKLQCLSPFQKITTFVMLAFCFFIQLKLAARTPLFASIIGLIIIYLFSIKKKIQLLYLSLSVVLALSLVPVVAPSFVLRFKEISINNLVIPTRNNFDSFNLRTGIYKCGIEIVQQNWIIGIGPGNVQTNLNLCLNNLSKEVYDGEDYNTHNQFIDYWAGMGILAPFALLLLFVFTIVKHFKNLRNMLLFYS